MEWNSIIGTDEKFDYIDGIQFVKFDSLIHFENTPFLWNNGNYPSNSYVENIGKKLHEELSGKLRYMGKYRGYWLFKMVRPIPEYFIEKKNWLLAFDNHEPGNLEWFHGEGFSSETDGAEAVSPVNKSLTKR